MLHPASLPDLGFIRRLLGEGATEGSFDPELAGATPAAEAFFANLGHALRYGYLRTPDAAGRHTARDVRVAGYVYATQAESPPVGFGLFKELKPGSFELWLTGIAAEARGHGHGRAMLGELLATPAGQKAYVVCCPRKSRSADVAVGLFRSFGFALCRATPGLLWLVSTKAPPEFATLIANAPIMPL